MMTISSLLRTLSLAALAGVAFIACDDTRDAANTADTTPMANNGVVQVDPGDSANLRVANAQIDTADGTLWITGSGKHAATWGFKDVTGILEERAGGGKTRWVLSLEAHDGVAKRHFRFRLLSDGEIQPGRYTFSDKARTMDAKFEEGGDVFRSLEGSNGWVQLESLQGDVARGEFEITLPSLDEKSSDAETLKGRFNQKVMR